MRVCATLALCFAAGTMQATTLPELRKSITGQEVEVSGFIGTGLDLMDAEALTFRDSDKTNYAVVFDAGRDARKKLEGCKFEMFGGTPCAMTGKAEIELDGARMRLIIFDITTIAAPAEMPR